MTAVVAARVPVTSSSMSASVSGDPGGAGDEHRLVARATFRVT